MLTFRIIMATCCVFAIIAYMVWAVSSNKDKITGKTTLAGWLIGAGISQYMAVVGPMFLWDQYADYINGHIWIAYISAAILIISALCWLIRKAKE